MRNLILTLVVTTDAPLQSFTKESLSLMVSDLRGISAIEIVNASALEERPQGEKAIGGTMAQQAISQSAFSNMAMNMTGKM